MSLNLAIPGQSLTDEPKNFAWERPPEITDPDKAIAYHMDYLSNPEVVESTLFILASGLPVKNFVDTILTNAVGNGIHSIDVSLIIKPVLEEAVVLTAMEADIKFLEEFDNSKAKEASRKTREETLILSRLKEALEDREDQGDEGLIEDTVSALGEQPMDMGEEGSPIDDSEMPLEDMAEQDNMMEQEPMPSSDIGMGLMSRGMS
tara:strand:+ start:2698 stop:3312 length:615 start_codon:yes stop_codon:yes gene_type:complete